MTPTPFSPAQIRLQAVVGGGVLLLAAGLAFWASRRLLRPRLQSEVDRVETHQRLPSLNGLPCIHQAFEHLADIEGVGVQVTHADGVAHALRAILSL